MHHHRQRQSRYLCRGCQPGQLAQRQRRWNDLLRWLNGNLTSTGGAYTEPHICWGDNDGGTTSGDWDTEVPPLENPGPGAFYYDISGLTNGTTYYYRCYATNSAGTSWAPSTSSFVAQTQLKLVGSDDASPTGSHGANYFQLTNWTAAASGNVNKIHIKCTSTGNVKAAIYAEGASPGTLLGANDTGVACSAGWNDIPLPASVPVTAGTNYWLAFVSDVPCVGYVAPASNTVYYKPAPYSTFTFQSSAGSGFSTYSGYTISAGWGTPPAPPSAAPLIQAPATSINFKWGTATNATKYHLQVNTASNFSGTNAFDGDVAGTSQEVTGLTLGTTYYFRVKAGNASGWGPWSEVHIVETHIMTP
jgi:hypothetical protein